MLSPKYESQSFRVSQPKKQILSKILGTNAAKAEHVENSLHNFQTLHHVFQFKSKMYHKGKKTLHTKSSSPSPLPSPGTIDPGHELPNKMNSFCGGPLELKSFHFRSNFLIIN